MNKNSILIELSESEGTKFGKEDFVMQSPSTAPLLSPLPSLPISWEHLL